MTFISYFGYGFYGISPIYLLIGIISLIISGWAQLKVKSAFGKYSRMANSAGMSGAEAARSVMDASGIFDVDVMETQGWLSDHYDPKQKVLRLSPQVYQGRSVAAIGVAAHEAGHAIQHANKYAPLGLRSLLVPTASFGSGMAVPLIIIGSFLGLASGPGMFLAKLGFWLFAAVVLFQIITLPVEFNASTRAKAALAQLGIVRTRQDEVGVSKMLSAAAMTYVAATLTALLYLLYFASIVFGSRD